VYPLDAIYGPRARRIFERENGFTGNMRRTLESSQQVCDDEPLSTSSYEDLVDLVSFLAVMNKRHNLFFRGQRENWRLRPTIFRQSWRSASGTQHLIPGSLGAPQRIWDYLNKAISHIVLTECEKLPMPRKATLRMFREAVWAVAQHYELWPTPLIDVTQNLRIAASFALWGGESTGCLYVVALPPSTNSVTFDADQHVVLARLQAVCPPVAKRPHYQDGFLVGRFPFMAPTPNSIDNNPAKVSDLGRRLIARITLTDNDDENQRRDRQASGRGFWSDDFPRMSERALMPDPTDDQLLDRFRLYETQIDEAMHEICQCAG
jgi:hypothetical protein